MKCKFKENLASEFLGLKSKMYSLIDEYNEENKKEKGVNKEVVKNIRQKEYIHVLFNKNNKRENEKNSK